jgi:ABC-type transporter Mla MlaB component
MISVPAQLTMQTAPAFMPGFCAQVAAATPAAVAAGKRVEVDCAALDGPGAAFDSAALSVMLAAARSAATQGGAVTLLNVPANLRKLATLYGVEGLLF